MGDVRLEQMLTELGDEIAYPQTPPVVDGVIDRLTTPTPARRRDRIRMAAAAAVVILVVLMALPVPRRAVADLLGIGGLSIVRVSELPGTEASGEPFGEAVSLSEVRSLVEFPILLPEGYPDPDEAYLDERIPGGLVTLAWTTAAGEYGLVITQMTGSVALPLLKKAVGPRSLVESATVGDEPAYWISGGPHELILLDGSGRDRVTATRLVGNTLLFRRDGVTMRVESALDLDEAAAIAESLAP